jgi:ATP-binding cassette subfamily C (CFTR/MRP) protein 4
MWQGTNYCGYRFFHHSNWLVNTDFLKQTSLLHVMLSELPVASGRCELNGKFSFTSQEAWLFPGTVRQNILVGKELNLSKYNAVLDACALEDDLVQFPHGDTTIVGERGVSLSGGQKARINLARALYQEADIYLLDDPLSAVDTHVSRHIFEKCIQTHLKGKLRVLVTHQLQYLPQADHIIVMNEVNSMQMHSMNSS